MSRTAFYKRGVYTLNDLNDFIDLKISCNGGWDKNYKGMPGYKSFLIIDE